MIKSSNIYGIEISADQVSNITNLLIEKDKEWQNRLLELVYPFIFIDAVHYKVRDVRSSCNYYEFFILLIRNN